MVLERGRDWRDCVPVPVTMSDAGPIERALARVATLTLLSRLTLGWGAVFLGLLYLGAVTGVVIMVRERRGLALALVVVVVGCFAALAPGPAADSRFRVPMLPGLAVAAGLGWERWLRPR